MKDYTTHEIEEGWGVRLTRKDGSTYLASGGDSLIYFARKRKDAVAFKRELAKHINSKGKVVPVRVTVEVGEED